MVIDVRVLRSGEEYVLENVADGVFDHPVDPRLTREFLGDLRHHLAVAIDAGVVVGMASAVHYIHPDKPPELWINEVGVAPTHVRRGLGTALLSALFERGRSLGCREAWVLTEHDNAEAIEFYSSLESTAPPSEPLMYTFRLKGSAPDFAIYSERCDGRATENARRAGPRSARSWRLVPTRQHAIGAGPTTRRRQLHRRRAFRRSARRWHRCSG